MYLVVGGITFNNHISAVALKYSWLIILLYIERKYNTEEVYILIDFLNDGNNFWRNSQKI